MHFMRRKCAADEQSTSRKTRTKRFPEAGECNPLTRRISKTGKGQFVVPLQKRLPRHLDPADPRKIPQMKPFLSWLATRLEDLAFFLRDKARTPDLSIPYPEGPEGDQ